MISNDIGVKLTDTNFGIALELMLQIVIELAYLAGLFFALRLNFPKEQKQIIAVGLLLKIASGMVYMISFSSPNSVSVIGLMFKFYSFFAFYLVFVMVTLRTPYNNVFRLFEKRENDLLELSKIDSLTGIYNHSAILKKIEHLVAKYEETDTIFFVSMLDIDDFKMVNDLYGHQKGDIILTEFAASLMASEYPDKVVGKYGGDEFIIAGVIENDFNTDERFRIFKNRILEVCTKTGIDFTFSAGTAIYNKGDQAKDLIYKADIKMYESKRSGKNRVTVWK